MPMDQKLKAFLVVVWLIAFVAFIAIVYGWTPWRRTRPATAPAADPPLPDRPDGGRVALEDIAPTVWISANRRFYTVMLRAMADELERFGYQLQKCPAYLAATLTTMERESVAEAVHRARWMEIAPNTREADYMQARADAYDDGALFSRLYDLIDGLAEEGIFIVLTNHAKNAARREQDARPFSTPVSGDFSSIFDDLEGQDQSTSDALGLFMAELDVEAHTIIRLDWDLDGYDESYASQFAGAHEIYRIFPAGTSEEVALANSDSAEILTVESNTPEGVVVLEQHF